MKQSSSRIAFAAVRSLLNLSKSVVMSVSVMCVFYSSFLSGASFFCI